jgi:branched-chain amino acid transport system ATP-binding protein
MGALRRSAFRQPVSHASRRKPSGGGSLSATSLDHPLLRIRDVSVRFAGIVALDRVSFDVGRGEICGLIGPNGAGKTTLFNCLSRLYAPGTGDITFDGRPLLATPVHGIATLGIGRTFQNLALFRTMSVRQNILVGAHARTRTGFVSDALRLPFVMREERALAREIDALIAMLDLDPVAGQPADALPFGTKKRVELARALAGKPALLLLDEPAGGLNHEEVDQLRTLILMLRDKLGLTVLLVEHHMSLVMGVSDKVVALDFGRKIAEGTPAAVQNHPDVISAYLGTAAA